MNKSFVIIETHSGRMCSRVDISKKTQEEITKLGGDLVRNMGSRYNIIIVDPDAIPEVEA